MKIGFFNYYEFYNNNRMFKDVSSPIGDDLSYPGVYLFKFAKTKNIKVSTIDTEPLESYDAIVFIDFPGFKNKYFKKLIKNKFENLYLLIWEPEVIRPNNWNLENHKYFKKIFTWNDKFVDGKKYIKINFSFQIPDKLYFDFSKKTKFCTLIASNKHVDHPFELYTERVKAIRYFEKNHPDDFDLYGFGWDKRPFKGPFRILNRIKFLRKTIRPRYTSYRPEISIPIDKSKREVLSQYKFYICYENSCNMNGYISEKIFDCFFAGCVPVYWGAPNVTDHIPEDTFINRRNFRTYDELYGYLKNMPDREYINYLDAIKDFIKSDKIYPFSVEYYADTLINKILKDINYDKRTT